MLHKVAIITVVYENYTVLQDFLGSLRLQSNKNFELFIVDSSLDKKIIDTRGISLKIFKCDNKGYAYGINVGLKEALKSEFEYFVVLNNDVFFKSDFIDSCLKSLIKHPSSLIGGKIYYAPGFEFHQKRYTISDQGKVLWYAGGDIDWNHAITPHRGVDEVDNGQFNKISEVDFINGAFMIFDKSVIDKVGFWDENYFLYFEDADFSVRVKRAGLKLLYDPTLILWHKNSQSTGGPGSNIHQKYQKVNRLRFGLKYAPLKTKLHLLKNYVFGQ